MVEKEVKVSESVEAVRPLQCQLLLFPRSDTKCCMRERSGCISAR